MEMNFIVAYAHLCTGLRLLNYFSNHIQLLAEKNR